jgi:hypothetical protein
MIFLFLELKLVLKGRKSDKIITIQEPHVIVPSLVESPNSIMVNSIKEKYTIPKLFDHISGSKTKVFNIQNIKAKPRHSPKPAHILT